LPGAVFSTSASALCVPPLRWGLLARLARRAVSEVLVRSSNWDLSGHCVSSVGRNVPRNLTRPACGFSSPPAARFQVRIYRRGATRAVGTGESCPEVPLARAAASGSRAHQLHPTFLRLPGVISELLARAFLKRRLSPTPTISMRLRLPMRFLTPCRISSSGQVVPLPRSRNACWLSRGRI
jgi:hypothetical protein